MGGFFMVDNLLDTYFFQNSGQHQIGICHPNVGDVFSAGGAKFNRDINAHYGQRLSAADNSKIGVIMDNPSSNVLTQWEYISAITGKDIFVLPPLKTLNGDYSGAYVVSYINTTSVENQMKEHGLKVWGLPGRLVDILKNKADCHALIEKLQIPGFKVPDYQIAHVDRLVAEISPFVDKIRANYQSANMPEYAVGVMLRGAESGGNYGACFVREEGQAIKFVPNGETVDAQYYSNWTEALHTAQSYLKSTSSADTTIEPRVVASRFMDLADSPGMSSFMTHGQTIHFGWNGQITSDKESSACIGTSSYQPQASELKTWQDKQEHSSEDSFANFLTAACQNQGIDPASIYGFTNVDWMVPGKLEVAYQHRIGQKASLTVAEINPRLTSWTDALLLVAAANRQPRTPRVLQQIIKTGVQSIDKYPLSPDISIENGLARLQALDQLLKDQGTRIIIRMRDKNPGLVISGNLELAHSRLAELKIAA